MLDKIIKYSLYSLVFLLPLFFLPLTNFPILLNKQIFLSVFVFLLLILWIVKIISSGKLNFRWDKVTGSVLLLVSILGISTLFSGSKIQSFWGMSFEPDTFFSFILYGLVFLLFANLINKDQIKSVLISILASSGVLSILFLIQSLWRPVFPWDFAQSIGFNSVGTVQTLAIFLAGAFIILLSLKNNIKSFLAITLGILLFVSIFIINYWLAWLGISLAIGLMIWFRLKTVKENEIISSKIILPLIILALSLIFIFIKIPTGNIVNLPSEVNLTHKASFDIAQKTLGEGTKNLVFGSGPATFAYDYDLYRSAGPNLTAFWQVRFNQGTSALLTFLATTGMLGILLFLLIIFLFFQKGLKLIKGNQLSPVGISVFIGTIYFLFFWFFYPSNFTLMFSSFLMLGLFNVCSGKEELNSKQVVFTKSPQKAFFIMLIGVLLIVASIFILYNISQKYQAALIFNDGLDLINIEETKLDEGIIKLNKAAVLDKKDTYLRNLSQAFLIKINQVLNDEELSEEEKKEVFQLLVSNAETSANNAVLLNPKNSQNWLQLGRIYENFMSLGVEGVEELVVSSYQKTEEITPQNPEIPFILGRVYKFQAEKNQSLIISLKEKGENEEAIRQLEENRDKIFDMAIEKLKKSTQLKIDFTPAYYLAAQIYELRGEKELAITNYGIVLLLDPEDKEVKDKIEQLQE
jgi:tetratricopeptide (TPR) repeat protein